MDFKLVSDYKPTGDQPKAIDSLVRGIEMGLDDQVLLGVTGSGKTFTMANVIAKLNRPTLVLAHNKTLAAQLCSEFREFFPENAVEYFISYYDYYQPEAYIAHTDTYIEKDSAINDEIERLRHSATSSLAERRDVIVVSSVSCIYGLGDPIDYKNMVISLRTGQTRELGELMRRLTDIRYERNDMNFTRNTFRVRGDTLEIYPAYWAGRAIRVEFFGDEIDRISEINAVTGMPERVVQHVAIYPASHYVASKEKMARAMHDIEEEMWQQVKFFEEHDKLLEAQRIRQRTQYDLEMLSEIGFCTGIENYSRVIAGQQNHVRRAELGNPVDIAEGNAVEALKGRKVGEVRNAGQANDGKVQQLSRGLFCKALGKAVLVVDVDVRIRHDARHRNAAERFQLAKSGLQN